MSRRRDRDRDRERDRACERSPARAHGGSGDRDPWRDRGGFAVRHRSRSRAARAESPARRSSLGIAALAAGIALLGTACAPIWTPVAPSSTPTPLATIQLEARLPRGWMVSSYETLGGFWHLTRHGDELEHIYLRRWPRSKVVKGTNRALRDGITIREIAALSLDSRRLDENVGSLELLSNKPTRVANRECYRLDYRYRTANALPRRTIEYGCPVGPWIYRFEFNAAAQHYFERHLEEFEEMVGSIVFKVPGA